MMMVLMKPRGGVCKMMMWQFMERVEVRVQPQAYTNISLDCRRQRRQKLRQKNCVSMADAGVRAPAPQCRWRSLAECAALRAPAVFFIAWYGLLFKAGAARAAAWDPGSTALFSVVAQPGIGFGRTYIGPLGRRSSPGACRSTANRHGDKGV
jgi:hypothetical protein